MFYLKRVGDDKYLRKDGIVGITKENAFNFNCEEGAKLFRDTFNAFISGLKSRIYVVYEED